MSHLPRISGRRAARVFENVGYEIVLQRGSHMRLHDSRGKRPPLTIPDHRELKSGLLRRLIRDAGMSVDEFLAMLD